MLAKVQSTMRRLGLMSEEELGRCAALEAAVAAAAAKMKEEDVPLDDVPDHFLDPLLCTVMKDPVRLPTRWVVRWCACLFDGLLACLACVRA